MNVPVHRALNCCDNLEMRLTFICLYSFVSVAVFGNYTSEVLLNSYVACNAIGYRMVRCVRRWRVYFVLTVYSCVRYDFRNQQRLFLYAALTDWWRCAVAQEVGRRPLTVEARIDFQSCPWREWQWGRFFSESFGFPLSLSFHQCSILLINHRRNIILADDSVHISPTFKTDWSF
jgi:hypothetical protein